MAQTKYKFHADLRSPEEWHFQSGRHVPRGWKSTLETRRELTTRILNCHVYRVA